MLFPTRQAKRSRSNLDRVMACLHQRADQPPFLAQPPVTQPLTHLFQQCQLTTGKNLLLGRYWCAQHRCLDEALDPPQPPPFAGGDQRQGDPPFAGAPGAPDTVHIHLRILGQVKVEDM